MPSIVRMSAPSASMAGIRQLLTIAPFSRIEHAPHSPSPQPSFVPVRRNSSRNTSSRRAMGNVSAWRGSPLTRHWMWMRLTSSDKRSRLLGHGFHQDFRRRGYLAHANSGRVFDGVDDRGLRTVHRQFADSLGAVRTKEIRMLLKKYADGRNVSCGGHDVVGHLPIGHAAIAPHDIFI